MENFEITEGHLNTGLRGFPVGTVRTSRVSPTEGVSYVGRPIAELAEKDPEEVTDYGNIDPFDVDDGDGSTENSGDCDASLNVNEAIFHIQKVSIESIQGNLLFFTR